MNMMCRYRICALLIISLVAVGYSKPRYDNDFNEMKGKFYLKNKLKINLIRFDHVDAIAKWVIIENEFCLNVELQFILPNTRDSLKTALTGNHGSDYLCFEF